MKYKKGESGNPLGRPEGSLNKKTEETLKRIEFVLSLLDATIEKDLKSMEPRQRAQMWSDLQEYIRPKLQRTELTGEIKTDNVLEIRRTVISKKV